MLPRSSRSSENVFFLDVGTDPLASKVPIHTHRDRHKWDIEISALLFNMDASIDIYLSSLRCAISPETLDLSFTGG
jgi:hypothetical protein